MKKLLLPLFISILFYKNSSAQNDSILPVQYFTPVPKITIFALEAVSENTAWFAAQRGIWGYTEDAGKTWRIDSIKVDETYPHFRSITVLNDSTVLLLSIASPAYLFKTTNKGKTWKLVYKNADKGIFFDCMKFYVAKNGIAIGDPIKECFPIITTADGGETWKQMDCVNLPKALDGEGLFAASNSNIDVVSKNIWFATGGKNTRVFHSKDLGKSFEMYTSPFPQGETMTGIYSLDFISETTGAMAGGNFDKTDASIVGLAITNNGGKTWQTIKSNKAFFGSCVQFRNADELYVTGMNGTFKYNVKNKKITEVKDNTSNILNFSTLRFTPSGNAIWLAGTNGKIALINLAK